MTDSTIALIFAAAAPTIVALATFMAQMRISTKSDEIHTLVNSSHDELKSEVAALKVELRESNKRADIFAAHLDLLARQKTAGSEPTPT